MAFTYKNYEESDKVKQAANDLALHNQNKVADWTGGTYGKQVQDAMDRIRNRDKFSYDLNGDMLYQQYKDQFMRQGKLAMQDTVGQAAALTGGYGNSYAVTAGNQMYQGYLQGLNDKVPELYQLARDAYDKEGEQMLNEYGMLTDAYGREYGEYQDKLAQWNNTRDYLADMYNNERNFDYGKYSDDRSVAQNSYQYESDLAYKKARDAVQDAQWQKEYNLKVQQANKSSSSGGSGGKSGGTTKTNTDTGKASDKTDLFQASIMTENEWKRRGKPEGTYQDYIDSTLVKWYESGPMGDGKDKLSASDAKYLKYLYELD